MSKRKRDPRQRELDFGFKKRFETYLEQKQEILNDIHATKQRERVEDYGEACIELAAALKKAVRQSGKSREEVVDDINRYFGWPSTDEVVSTNKQGRKGYKGKHLSFYMFNHYLSKPNQYTIPGYLLYAIHYVTGSLEPCKSFAEAEGGDVIYMHEKKDLVLGKIENAMSEMQTLKKKLKGSR